MNQPRTFTVRVSYRYVASGTWTVTASTDEEARLAALALADKGLVAPRLVSREASIIQREKNPLVPFVARERKKHDTAITEEKSPRLRTVS